MSWEPAFPSVGNWSSNAALLGDYPKNWRSERQIVFGGMTNAGVPMGTDRKRGDLMRSASATHSDNHPDLTVEARPKKLSEVSRLELFGIVGSRMACHPSNANFSSGEPSLFIRSKSSGYLHTRGAEGSARSHSAFESITKRNRTFHP